MGASTVARPVRGQRGQRATSVALVTLLLIVLAGSGLSWSRVHRHYLERAVDTGLATLQLAVDGVDATLRTYRPLPSLIAERPILLDVLREPNNNGLLPFANQQLRQTARTIHATGVYLLDRSGQVLIASDYRNDQTLIGRRFGHRADFAAAIQGRLGTSHGISEVTGGRGFQFAAPVLDGVRVLGVLVVRVDVEALERHWRVEDRDIALLDPDGVVFLSSRPQWRLRTMTPLSPAVRRRLRDAGQFPSQPLRSLDADAHPLESRSARLRFTGTDDDAVYLASSTPLDAKGWHAVSLTPASSVLVQALKASTLWSLALVTLALAALMGWQGRARARERLAQHQEQRRRLESQVQARTADLDASNVALKVEIGERRRTEERLRRTQRELVQAGKLSGLGRMSAAVAHEINQPLAAVKTYARNTVTLVERNRLEEARDNLRRISDMVDRIARLCTHLRSFARRPGDSIGPIRVATVINEAIAIMAPQTRKLDATVHHEPIAPGLHVIGGQVRLQQVIVNLLSNALDAMSEHARPCVHIHVQTDDDSVDIVVRDQGPGLSEAAVDQAFEPFFTTKESGNGLGLGLSISFNIVEDFGGSLIAANHPEGGAQFRVRLRRAAASEMASDGMGTDTASAAKAS